MPLVAGEMQPDLSINSGTRVSSYTALNGFSVLTMGDTARRYCRRPVRTSYQHFSPCTKAPGAPSNAIYVSRDISLTRDRTFRVKRAARPESSKFGSWPADKSVQLHGPGVLVVFCHKYISPAPANVSSAKSSCGQRGGAEFAHNAPSRQCWRVWQRQRAAPQKATAREGR